MVCADATRDRECEASARAETLIEAGLRAVTVGLGTRLAGAG